MGIYFRFSLKTELCNRLGEWAIRVADCVFSLVDFEMLLNKMRTPDGTMSFFWDQTYVLLFKSERLSDGNSDVSFRFMG